MTIGNQRRAALNFDRKYGFGNHDRDWAIFDPMSPVLITGAVAAGSNQNFRVISQSGNACVTPSTFLTVATGGIPGGQLITTSGTANQDSAQIDPYAGSGFAGPFPPTLGTNAVPQFTVFDTVIRPSQIVTCAFLAGLKLTTSGANSQLPATDNDQAIFYFDTSAVTLNPTNVGPSANWLVIASVGGTDLFRDTGIPVVANKDYRLKVVIRNDGVPQFYINGGNPFIIPAQGPLTAAALLKPSVQVVTRAAAASSLGVRMMRLQRFITSN